MQVAARAKRLFAAAFTALTISAVLLPCTSYGSVWDIRNEWTLAAEDQFGAWLAAVTDRTVSDDGKLQSPLFEPGGALHGLPVDCADFIYAVRIIFAAQNGLPFSSKASIGGKRLDASKSHWDSIPREKRLRAFLKDVVAGASTQSLLRDTVSVTVLSREHVKPGTILLGAPSVRHSWIIRRVRDTGIPELVYASVPALEELFYRDGLPRGEAVFGRIAVDTSKAGFRSFCVVGKSCPGSSTSQAVAAPQAISTRDVRVQNWRPTVFRALQIRPEPLIESIGREITNLCRAAKARAVIVEKAALYKLEKSPNGTHPSQSSSIPSPGDGDAKVCLRGADYFNYSTENRDAHFKESFIDLWELWMTTNDLLDEARISGRNLPRPLAVVLDQIAQVFTDSIIDTDAEAIVCPVTVERVAKGSDSSSTAPSSPTVLSLRDLRQLSLADRLTPDPNESTRARWGLEAGTGICRPTR